MPQFTQLADCQAHFWNPGLLSGTNGTLRCFLQEPAGAEGSQMRKEPLVPANDADLIKVSVLLGGMEQEWREEGYILTAIPIAVRSVQLRILEAGGPC